ncbi:helix-turn-helix domain-containing protein [Streptomyces sp. APSN-46.1]|uniref:helix-turn-helix domain-containing protein n=1 Tax=Streptomyces sp. APSN-46.1 TaxID=2929049 RepID=UPI001FB27FF7|nr:helix-turn-helix transcriptional regulator [Streptomyces sp. APSN-46.1]MCJ1680537.1 helix-turn-helix domain-containing protein [Streptomyces sp. APSN-46.1]
MGETLGDVIRRGRQSKRLSQGEVGARVGYSASWMSRVENGKVSPDSATLAALCDVLDVSAEAVGLERDDVHRRKVLTLGLGVGIAAALPASSVAATADPKDLVERSLFRLPNARPVTRESLVTALTQTRTLFQEAQYTELGRKLPQLIAGSLASNAHDVAARSYVLLAQLAIKNYQGFAWVAADRARTQAHLTGNPVVMGEAAHSMGIAMRRAGEYQAAIDHLNEAAGRLGRRPDELAMKGTLLLTAGYSAAQAGWRGQATDYMGEAEETAGRRETESQKLYIPGVFGIDQTRVFRISVHHALGEGDQALNYAAEIPPERLPNAERRGRMCMDVARVWRDMGEPEKAFHTLRALERYAPQEARRPKVRSIASELLALNGEIPGLRRFAQRIGATV